MRGSNGVLKKKDVVLVVSLFFGVLFVGCNIERGIIVQYIIPALMFSIVGILVFVLRKIQQGQNHYATNIKQLLEISNTQTECYISLLSIIKPIFLLPSTRGWAASPDVLKLIAEITLEKKPTILLEAGSGVSTLVLAYCLKINGSGRLISLEHDLVHADKSKKQIKLHGLEAYAEVIHAPLVEVDIEAKKWFWYDLSVVDIEPQIDFVFVDGPPSHAIPDARYPMLPSVYNKLRDEFVLVLDDGARVGESDVVKRWLDEYRDLNCSYVDLEKGAYIITRQNR